MSAKLSTSFKSTPESGKKRQIIVTSIPYGVNKGNLEQAIGEIIVSRKLPQLTGLTNEMNAKEKEPAKTGHASNAG